MSAINVCLIYPKFLACLCGSLFMETILRQSFRKNPKKRFFVMALLLIFIEYERRQRYFRSTCAQIPDHPILPFSMPEVLQLFTNEFVSNICVRNICLVMRRYNNTFLKLVSLVSSLSSTIKTKTPITWLSPSSSKW